jgi:hypothetical protein
MACTNDGDGYVVETPLTVDANISGAVTTRMVNVSWEKNDSIGISVSNNGGGITDGTNVKYITSGGDGKFVSTTPIYFKDDKTVTFSAYYPFTNSKKISSNLISVNTKDQTKQNLLDYLYGTGTGTLKSKDGIEMTFNHKMAKITFSILAGNGASADSNFADHLGQKYKVAGLKHAGTFSIADGTAEPLSTAVAADLEVAADTTSIIILPQTPTELKLIVTYNNLDYTASVLVPANGFAAGNNYIYTVKVNETGLTVSKSVITPWTSNTVGDASAEHEYPNDITDDSSGYNDLGWEEDDLGFKTKN